MLLHTEQGFQANFIYKELLVGAPHLQLWGHMQKIAWPGGLNGLAKTFPLIYSVQLINILTI